MAATTRFDRYPRAGLLEADTDGVYFAVPADWVTELPERMKAAEEKKTEQVAAVRASGVTYNPAAEGLPAERSDRDNSRPRTSTTSRSTSSALTRATEPASPLRSCSNALPT